MEFVVRGHITHADTGPIDALQVDVYDVRTSGNVLLGSTSTDPRGYYELVYDGTDIGGKQLADLEVSVVVQSETFSVTRCQAPPTATINLTVDGESYQPSEYDTVMSAIGPALAGASVASLDIEPPISPGEVERLFGGGPDAEIVFRVDSLSRHDGRRLLLHGRLTMNGVSRPVAFSGDARHVPGSRIEARGTARVDIREWRIRPPRRFLGLVSMHHELTLTFDATFAPQAMARGGDVIELAPQFRER